jgi:integral membrane protein
MNNILQRFRLISFLEGCSYLAFAITMPLKYIYAITAPNYIIGMAHGVLFILYCVFLGLVGLKYKWSIGKLALGFIAALIPFGTFYANKKLFV